MRLRSPLSSLIALLVAGAFGGVQVAESIHSGLVRHEVCAEHGELIHADAEHASATAETPPSPSVFADGSSSAHASHQHCALAEAVRTSAIAGEPRAEVLEPARVPRRQPVARLVILTLSVLTRAPKGSPPIV